jgi:hypothetical protein
MTKAKSGADWRTVALYIQRHKHRLDACHHEFVDDMAAHLVPGHEPSTKQCEYLERLLDQVNA